MDKVKYIPEDIVKLNNEVVTIAETNLFCYSIIDSGGDFYTNVVYNIKPIPLTPQILEKNGWKPNDMMPYPTYFKGKTSEYVLMFDGYFWRFKYDGRFLPVEIKYIHQLQHLLFGLGLNSKIEV